MKASLILIACLLAVSLAADSYLPFAYRSANPSTAFISTEDSLSTMNNILTKFAGNFQQDSKETINIVRIRSADSIENTFKYINANAKYFSELLDLTTENFSTQLEYTPSSFKEELAAKLESSGVSTIQTDVDISNISQVKTALKNAESAAHTFITFEFNVQEDAEPLSFIESAQEKTTTRVLQATTTDTEPNMLQIPEQTLFALLLLFVILLPILWIGISSLYGVQTPEKFASQNLVVGREY